jgi:ferredoxin
MSFVESLCVAAMQCLHARAEVFVRGLEKQMDVIRHEAIRQAQPPLPPDDLPEDYQVGVTVDVVEVDVAAVIAAGEDMVNAARDLLARLSRHVRNSEQPPKLAPP